MDYYIKIDKKNFIVDVRKKSDQLKVLINKKEFNPKILSENNSLMKVIIDKKAYDISYNSDNYISVNGEEFVTEIIDEQIHKLIKSTPVVTKKREIVIKAPMPGLIVDVLTKEGNAVNSGQELLIIEAMKMQNCLKSPKKGIIKKIFAKKGDTVNSNENLISIK